MKASFADQAVIFRRTHNWIMCWLYTGTFGSFIGFSAAFPLLSKILFPEVNALQYAFLGPLVGALARAARRQGLRPDRRRADHLLGVHRHEPRRRRRPLRHRHDGRSRSPSRSSSRSFLFLFAASGVGNASTFQMIPAIMRKEMARLEPGLTGGRQRAGSRTRKPRPSSASPRRSPPTAPSSSRRASAPRSR